MYSGVMKKLKGKDFACIAHFCRSMAFEVVYVNLLLQTTVKVKLKDNLNRVFTSLNFSNKEILNSHYFCV